MNTATNTTTLTLEQLRSIEIWSAEDPVALEALATLPNMTLAGLRSYNPSSRRILEVAPKKQVRLGLVGDGGQMLLLADDPIPPRLGDYVTALQTVGSLTVGSTFQIPTRQGVFFTSPVDLMESPGVYDYLRIPKLAVYVTHSSYFEEGVSLARSRSGNYDPPCRTSSQAAAYRRGFLWGAGVFSDRVPVLCADDPFWVAHWLACFLPKAVAKELTSRTIGFGIADETDFEHALQNELSRR